MLYALADYKQLVMAYKTKHAELVKAVAFWKTSMAWFAAVTLVIAFIAGGWFLENSRQLSLSRQNCEVLDAKVSGLSQKLAATEQELEAARKDAAAKEAVIQNLERNISATSKKLLEQLLPEGAAQPAGQSEREGRDR